MILKSNKGIGILELITASLAGAIILTGAGISMRTTIKKQVQLSKVNDQRRALVQAVDQIVTVGRLADSCEKKSSPTALECKVNFTNAATAPSFNNVRFVLQDWGLAYQNRASAQSDWITAVPYPKIIGFNICDQASMNSNAYTCTICDPASVSPVTHTCTVSGGNFTNTVPGFFRIQFISKLDNSPQTENSPQMASFFQFNPLEIVRSAFFVRNTGNITNGTYAWGTLDKWGTADHK